MAKESGWWSLDCTVEPNDTDLEHIIELIRMGFTSGEVAGDEEEFEEEEYDDGYVEEEDEED